jgi:trans-aconitate methyltransferase
VPQPRRISDVGCATGDFSSLLKTAFPATERLLGIDVVDSAVACAHKRVPAVWFRTWGFSVSGCYTKANSIWLPA